MSGVSSSPEKTAVADGHVVGKLEGSDGPTVIVMACLHGNEPAGLVASRKVLERLVVQPKPIRGRLFVLLGNTAALEARTRYLDRDLNRVWTDERVAEIDHGDPPEDAEARQQAELLRILRGVIESSAGKVYFLDLHTTSAEGPPFLTVGDTLANRDLALALELPLILGLEEQVDGALLEYLNNFGVTTIGVEAGQHDHPESPRRHEAVLWLALDSVGLIFPEAAEDLDDCRRFLRRVRGGAPRVVEVRQRHAIGARDLYRMEPGFVNFDPVRRGQKLATDRSGPVLAAEDGIVLLPLYQGKGEDGFFVAQAVNRMWLRISAGLRRLGLGSTLHWLPGVRRDPELPEALVVDTRIARYCPLEIFHLFGYRKLRRTGTRLVVTRRRFDLAPPDRVSLLRSSK